jgi:hypothetical protein
MVGFSHYCLARILHFSKHKFYTAIAKNAKEESFEIGATEYVMFK